ncbi:helix-turn-helix domain-containing protein [Aquitalea magnusonii]|uniref:helix-turn-helix domain-containing protein n=1 Tax=Aquitalea magnusonii TaxID=332411 RepID=UPI0007506280|nr:helix-turn-helix transcriptional regulator [Aquitalea magnusonii]
MEEFSVTLRRLMALSDKGVSDLASGCNVSRQTVYRWLNGESLPNAEHIHDIAEALGIDEGQLAGGVAEYVRRQAIRQLMDLAVNLSDTELCILLKIATEFFNASEKIRNLEDSLVTLRMLPKR